MKHFELYTVHHIILLHFHYHTREKQQILWDYSTLVCKASSEHLFLLHLHKQRVAVTVALSSS